VIGAIAPISVKGVTIESCPWRAKVDQPLRHRDIERARAVGVDDRVAMRLARKAASLRPRKSCIISKAVHDLRRAARKDEGEFVGQGQLASVVK
jgi:hypothetical protein